LQFPRGITGFDVSTNVDIRAFRTDLYTELRVTLADFSRGIINVLYNIPSDENEVHILGSRNRIVDVLCTALKFGGSTDDFQVHLGAIAAVYQQPELGREVMLLDFEP